ncbi:MAG: beta strand repeat-containing protein [Verrucomicrobiia bacterium]
MPTPDDYFGMSIAGSGSGSGGFVVVGAPGKVDGSAPGEAFIFSTTTWNPQFTLGSENPVDGGQFGFSVSAGNWNNSAVVVGAPGEDGGGNAYLFDASSGAPRGTLTNPGGSTDGFGWSVAGGNGDRIVVGAPNKYGVGPGSGAAYVYMPWNGELIQTLDGSSAGGHFGAAVASTENVIIVGAPDEGTGTVSIFDSNTGIREFLLGNPTPSKGGGFGTSLSVMYSKLLVGAPGGSTDAGAAHLYRLGDGSLTATIDNPGSTGDAFGQSVALFDGNTVSGTTILEETLLIGAGQKTQGGAAAAGGAYLFQPSAVGIRFSDSPGQDTVLTTSMIESMLGGGLNLFLQANNDITVVDPITVSASGNGGSLTLQAGRSILINADVTTDNGAVTIVANETAANGVISSYVGPPPLSAVIICRESGDAVIIMKEGTALDTRSSIDAGIAADVKITLSDGAGLMYNQSGDITLANITAGNLLVVNNGPSGGNIVRAADSEGTSPLVTANGVAFLTAGSGSYVGTTAEPIRIHAANLNVSAGSDGVYLRSLNSEGTLTLGYSALGTSLGITTPGDFNLTADGAVTTDTHTDLIYGTPLTAFNVGGAVIINAGGHNLTLGNSTAVFGEVDLSGHDVSVTQSGTAKFGASTITGNLLVEAAGVSQTAVTTMTVDGAAGFTSSGAVTLDNTGNRFTGPVSFADASSVSFHNSRATDLGATSVGSLSVVSVGSITDSGTLAIASGATFDSGTDDITLDDASSTFGSLNLTGANLLVKENSAMSFSGVDASGDFSAESTGTIGQAMGISVTGDASFKAGGDITLLYSANTFGGAVSFDAAGHAVQLNTGVAPLDLGTSAAASLTIHANGPLTDSGDLTISGAAVFDIGSAYDITLDRSGSTFGSVSLTANNATLRENDATDLASVSVMGTLDVQSGGVITDSGMLMVGAAASFDAGSSDITLDNATSSFGSVLLSGANATVQRNGPVVLGASTLTGNLAVGAGAGNISQVGSVSVGGTASFSSGNTVTLGDTGNDFQGAVSFSSGGASSLTSIGPVVLGASTVGGNLDVTAGGAITQTGILVVDGTWATFTAGSGNDITLGNPANDFVGVQIGSGKDVKVVDANNLVIGTSLVSGNFEVTAGGPITQSGVITANGNGTTALLTAGPANSITLSNPLNDWNTVRIVSANNVLLADANAVDLGASTVSGTLDVSAGGVIVQSGALDIMGNASFGTTGNYISLLNVGNKFSGQLSFSGTASVGGYVEAVNSVATTLGGFSVMGDFSLVSNGAITQAGAMNIPSEAFFDATGNNITLGSGMNTFGSLLLNGANVTVSEYNATILDGVIATGTFNLTSNGAVSQTGPMGAHLLTVSAMGAIDLADSGNQIGILGNMSSSGAVDVYDSTGGLSVQGAVSGGSSAGNTVTIRTAGGNLALDVGASILASPGNDIRFVTDQSFVNNVGAGVLSMSGGGRFLAYAGSSAVNVLNGLISSFTEYGVTWPTAPLAVNIGNGELFSYAPPPPPPPPDNTDQIIQDVNNALNPTETIPGTGGPTLFALLGGDTGGTGGTGGIGGTGDGGGTGGGTGGTGDGTLAGGSSLGGGTGGTTGGTTDPGGDKASVPAGGGMRMGAQGLNSTGFQQVPQTLQRAISLQIRNQLQGAIGNF